MLLPRGVANRKQRQLTAYNALVTPLTDSCPCPCPCPCPCLAAPAPVPVSMCMPLLVTATRDCDCDCERGTHPPLAALNVAVTVTGRERGGRGLGKRVSRGGFQSYSTLLLNLYLYRAWAFFYFSALPLATLLTACVCVCVRACACACMPVYVCACVFCAFACALLRALFLP